MDKRSDTLPYIVGGGLILSVAVAVTATVAASGQQSNN